ncbi:putative GABA permease [Paraburkholderia terrae]|uniref:GABA permease n=1 Tax=Paraburkholderia terrae TaxID=311230 RepID=A0ABM7TNJ1_9BURK|nr:amino acid permease [Paraburkholderia terrae]BCZ80166.1 putative GABA permease [Paraburkholderia terrae]
MQETPRNALAHSLKQRHVVMLSIGGSIGAGLFVGSGHAIAEAGPAAIIAYVLASLLVVLVMRMLGEMACAMPDSGSFSTYAGKAIGPWAGFMIGWMYWWFWVLVLPLEATAAANILNSWFPQVEMWKFCLAVTFVLTVANLVSVKNYGELEFWFSVVKVTAIVIFIACGFAAIAGFIPNVHVDASSNIFAHGGFAPKGLEPVAGAMLTTMFTFLGTEVVTIAAAESANPEKEIARAITSVVWRISLFYIGSIFVIISILPWSDPALTQIGSYQAVLQVLHVPYAKLLIDLLILVAVCSCLNSGLYTASRMIFSLSARGLAPSVVRRTSSNGVPVVAVLLSTSAAFAGVAANYLAPKYVFEALLSTTGSMALLVYLVVAVSQIRLRAQLERDGKLKVRMWMHPFLGLFVILLIIGAFAVMVSGHAHRGEVVATLGLSALLACMGLFHQRRMGTRRHEPVMDDDSDRMSLDAVEQV